MSLEKTKEEAARLLAKYWGCKIKMTYEHPLIVPQQYVTEDYAINHFVLKCAEQGKIQSFQILLRGIDEMSEAEKEIFFGLCNQSDPQLVHDGCGNESVQQMNYFTAESIDYLRSIGVATKEEDRKLIIIKN